MRPDEVKTSKNARTSKMLGYEMQFSRGQGGWVFSAAEALQRQSGEGLEELKTKRVR